MARKETLAVEEEHSRRRKREISAVSSTEATDMHLVVPSYTEKYKAEIKEIIAKKRANCRNSKHSSKRFLKQFISKLPFLTVET